MRCITRSCDVHQGDETFPSDPEGVEMICHACARFCFVGLCTDHLVASFHGGTIPQDGCEHHPERAFAPQPRKAAHPAPAYAAA